MDASKLAIVGLAIAVGACSVAPSAERGPSDAPASTPPATGDDAVASTACEEHKADFDAVVAKLEAAIKADKIPGAAIAIVCRGDRIFSAGVGKTVRGGSDPVTAKTRFQIASITKTFTTTAALRLAERGIIHLDSPVREQLPFLDAQTPYTRPFTWAELLSHTAGFPTGFDDENLDLEPRIRAHAKDPLWSPPGAVFNYSNEGFAVAGLGLQLAAGEPIGALIEKEVFGPAQMTGATMDAVRLMKEGNYAVGLAEDDTLVNPTDSYLASSYYAPMGGAWASAEDMAKFARELLKGGGTLLHTESLAEMSKARTRAWPGTSYGLGLEVADHGGIITWSHSGGVAGFGSNLVMVPSEGFAIVTLLNGESGFPQLEGDALAAFAAKTLAEPAVEAPQPKDSDDAIGIYTSVSLGQVTVQKAATGGGLEVVLGKANKTVPFKPGRARDSFTFEAPDGYPDDVMLWRVNGAVRFFVAGTGVGERN